MRPAPGPGGAAPRGLVGGVGHGVQVVMLATSVTPLGITVTV